MDASSLAALATSTRDLAAARWRQLGAAIGATAVVGALLFYILVKVVGGIAGGDDASAGPPSMMSVYISLTIAWAVLVTAFVLPMTATTAALTEDEDDAPLGWFARALATLPAMWLRLAIPTAPLLLLGMWAFRDLINAFTQAFSAMATGAEPGEPLSFQLLELLFGSAPMRWAVFATILGLWFMWSATRATGQHDRAVPHAPWRMFDRNPIMVGALGLVTAIVLGPLLGKALEPLGSNLGMLEGVADSAGAEEAGTFAVLVIGIVVSTFIGAVAVPWIALFGDDVELPLGRGGDSSGSPLAPEAAASSEPAAAPAAAPVDAQASGQVVDRAFEAPAGGPGASWWYLQAGASVLVQVAAAPEVGAAPAVADAAGAWLALQGSSHPGTATFTATDAGWYLLGAWNPSAAGAQVAVRLTLPADAQPAPEQAAS